MGLSPVDMAAVTRLRREGYFTSWRKVVEIGAQQLNAAMCDSRAWMEDCADAFEVEQREFSGPAGGEIVHGDYVGQNRDAPPARDVWRWLGFEYASIDVDGSPGAIPLDLNVAQTPGYMYGRSSLVMNCGTTEHIANQLNAFRVIHELTAVGGVMLHNVPAQGFLSHGLINYNPKFFWALSAANGYKWLWADYTQSKVFYETPTNIIDEVEVFQPEAAARMNEYRFADAGLFVVMQKTLDIPFVPPIDVPTGTITEIEELRERYWTIFQPDLFERRILEVDRVMDGE